MPIMTQWKGIVTAKQQILNTCAHIYIYVNTWFVPVIVYVCVMAPLKYSPKCIILHKLLLSAVEPSIRRLRRSDLHCCEGRNAQC